MSGSVTFGFEKPRQFVYNVSVERFGILAASSWMEEDGVEEKQPITGLRELQVGGRLSMF